MVENIHDIVRRIDEELAAAGNVYNDETVMYMITGELTPNKSEKRLINDVTYLLRKIKLLQDVLKLSLIESENMSFNNRFKQTTVDETLK